MSRSLFLSLSVLAASAGISSAALSTFTTSGTYDESSVATNAVDTIKIAVGESYSTYTAAFAAAFAAGTGGVINFDNITMTSTSVTDTVIRATYGVSQANTLVMTNEGPGLYQIQTAAVGTPISGATFLRSSGGATQTYNFGTSLSMVGFTVLARPSLDRNITATVTFSDLSTAVLTDTVTAGTQDDTFFGFTAPNGLTITKLTIGAGTDNYFAIDDLAFVIPEPSSVMMGGAGMIVLLLRRRRNA